MINCQSKAVGFSKGAKVWINPHDPYDSYILHHATRTVIGRVITVQPTHTGLDSLSQRWDTNWTQLQGTTGSFKLQASCRMPWQLSSCKHGNGPVGKHTMVCIPGIPVEGSRADVAVLGLRHYMGLSTP